MVPVLKDLTVRQVIQTFLIGKTGETSFSFLSSSFLIWILGGKFL